MRREEEDFFEVDSPPVAKPVDVRFIDSASSLVEATPTIAEIVLIGIGGADLGAGDARLEAGHCKAEACYAADLRQFGRDLDKTASVIRDMRTSKQAVLRAITLPNVVTGAKDVVPSFITQDTGVYQNDTLKRYICSAMQRHDALCVDAYGKFNGPREPGTPTRRAG